MILWEFTKAIVISAIVLAVIIFIAGWALISL